MQGQSVQNWLAICKGRRCDVLDYKNNDCFRACNALLEPRFSNSIAQHKAQHMYTATQAQTGHVSRQVQDIKDQVHYPDQCFVHNILMMLYIAQT